jgi:hypothetical protein
MGDQPLLAVERAVERVPGRGPCQALAAEGGGRKARLYKGQASLAMIATGGPTGSRQPLAVRYATHSKFNRASFLLLRVNFQPAPAVQAGA